MANFAKCTRATCRPEALRDWRGSCEFCPVAGTLDAGIEEEQRMSAGQGSAGNVIAALASFFIAGLGQLLQGRFLIGVVQFVLAAILWLVWLGWIIHLWSILDAALYDPPRRYYA
jgi:TM2 domain-containing membrane protein YozV